MAKVMVVLRSVFLLFIVVYLLGALPLALLVSGEASKGNVNVGIDVVKQVASSAWLAVGWIALETAVGWARVWLDRRKAAKVAAPAGPPAP
jgi:hypothetical protein